MPIPVSELARAAAPIFYVSVEDIMGPRRLPEYFRARVAIVLAAKASGRGESEIGRALGSRDPGTIANARRRGEKMRERDSEFASACAYLERLGREWAIAHTQEMLSKHAVNTIKREARGVA